MKHFRPHRAWQIRHRLTKKETRTPWAWPNRSKLDFTCSPMEAFNSTLNSRLEISNLSTFPLETRGCQTTSALWHSLPTKTLSKPVKFKRSPNFSTQVTTHRSSILNFSWRAICSTREVMSNLPPVRPRVSPLTSLAAWKTPSHRES